MIMKMCYVTNIFLKRHTQDTQAGKSLGVRGQAGLYSESHAIQVYIVRLSQKKIKSTPEDSKEKEKQQMLVWEMRDSYSLLMEVQIGTAPFGFNTEVSQKSRS